MFIKKMIAKFQLYFYSWLCMMSIRADVFNVIICEHLYLQEGQLVRG